MFINKNSPIPAYYQLRTSILKKIETGEYSAGSLIPSERELGDNLGISRMTVRQALNQLVSEGTLYREKGKGTFVSVSKIQQRNVMSFSDTVAKKGMKPSTKILHFKKDFQPFEINELLGLTQNDPVYQIKRLRLADDLPIAIEEVFIPEKFCPELEKMTLDGSLYKMLQEQYSHFINYIDNNIEADKPSKEEKELLELPLGIPILRISGISFSSSGQRLFFERDVYRSDKYNYNVRIFMNKDA